MNWIQLNFIDQCFAINSTNQCLLSWLDAIYPEIENVLKLEQKLLNWRKTINEY